MLPSDSVEKIIEKDEWMQGKKTVSTTNIPPLATAPDIINRGG